MPIQHTPASPATKSTSNWRRAGLTHGGSFTRRVTKTHSSPIGCYARSAIFIASSEHSGQPEWPPTEGSHPRSSGPPIYRRLHRVLTRLKMRGVICPVAAWAGLEYALNNWTLLGVYLDDGRIEIDQNLVEMPSAPRHLERKIGCSLVKLRPGNAAPSSTPSSSAAAVVNSILMLICSMSSPDCPPPPTGK